ncbi:golgin candidate 4-like protein [Carex littledalei]|uniref:Golgin candidate 4-like protein n=1 Tax=Carex littledalei TaxID=544730 RepID=A0A833S227_9POAL|nr:golgin candidate 4-like protein [Carex littledalei]
MRSSIATYRESLSRIANDLSDEDAADSPEFLTAAASFAGETPPSVGRRRRSLRTPPPPSPSLGSPIPNGSASDHDSYDEIARYKADIQKLQASEAEIKALSFNYAAMLKEKEEQLSKLRDENGTLKKSLEAKVSTPISPRGERSALNNSKGNGQTQRQTMQENSRLTGINSSKLTASTSNGSSQMNGVHKEYSEVLEENKRLELEIKKLREQLKTEREQAMTTMHKFEDESKWNASFQRELHELKVEKERMSANIRELQMELNDKRSELRQLQEERITRAKTDLAEESPDTLKSVIAVLKAEIAVLKQEKDKFEAEPICATSEKSNQNAFGAMGMVLLSEKFVEEMKSSIALLEKNLEETSKEKDKALQELGRLKQHLLDKENEDSIIEELEATVENQKAHIVQLERALRQEMSKKEEIKALREEEIQKSNELINKLRLKLSSCMSSLESKNTELVNLQTALGQYYAESEAKERLGRDLAMAREEIAKVSQSLRVANEGIEMAKREKEEATLKLSQSEGMLADAKRFIQRLEDDKSRLQLALEKSMTTLNRMSLDSDNQVDRRIVIKLLVTYFQRNHSKEVLDLMVRMLGFSEEDKQRIGVAQTTAGKGMVRGVLGLPGKLVGGILGGSHPSTQASPNNQDSFADLWVDFLLKEEEEREKREASSSNQDKSVTSDPSNSTTTSNSNAFSYASNQVNSSEFSTVPLNSTSFNSRLPQR